MHPTLEDTGHVLGEIEDAIISVGQLLDSVSASDIDGHVAAMDRALRRAYDHAEATARFFTLLRDPVLEDYSPAGLIRSLSAHHPAAVTRKDAVEAVRMCKGDAEQVTECVRMVVDNAQITTDASLQCEVTTGEGAPRIVFTLDAPQDFQDTLRIGDSFVMPLEDFGHRWTAASGGGHIAQTAQVLILFLEGDRDIPRAMPAFNRAAMPARRLARALRSWRGAIGHYEPGFGTGDDIASLYRETLGRAAAQLRAIRQALAL